MISDLRFRSELSGMPHGIEIRERGQGYQDENRNANDALVQEDQRGPEAEQSACAEGDGQRTNEGRNRAGSAQDAENDRAQPGSFSSRGFSRVIGQPSVSFAMQPIGGNRLAESLELQLLRPCFGKLSRVLGVAFRANQNFSCAGLALKAGGQIHHVANRRVVLVVFGAEPADASVAGGDADGSLQRKSEAGAQTL